MNKVEKYLMRQIELKDNEIESLRNINDHLQNYMQQYFKEQRFINIVSEKAQIKSFESSDGTIKSYIDLGDVNDYGSDKNDFNFVVDLLGLNKSECCDCESKECCDCECEDCFEEGGEENE